MSRIDARNGAFGIIPPSLDGGIVTQDFPMFRVDTEVVLARYRALVPEELSLPDKGAQKEILEFYDVLASITLSSENAMKISAEMEQHL